VVTAVAEHHAVLLLLAFGGFVAAWFVLALVLDHTGVRLSVLLANAGTAVASLAAALMVLVDTARGGR
jgi:hypothetical protein